MNVGWRHLPCLDLVNVICLIFTCSVVTTYRHSNTIVGPSGFSLFVFTYVRQDNIKVETPGTCCCTLAVHPNDLEWRKVFIDLVTEPDASTVHVPFPP